MNIVCSACSKPLSVPEESLPKNVDQISAKCPLCGAAIQIQLKNPSEAAAETPAPADPPPEASATRQSQAPPSPFSEKVPAQEAPAPPVPPQKVSPPQPQTKKEPTNGSNAHSPPALSDRSFDETLITPLIEDRVADDGRLAMVCFDDPKIQALLKTELEALGYTPHVSSVHVDSIQRLRQNKYELVLLREEFGGSAENNVILNVLQPMAMNLRRHMCVGLIGKNFITLDPMMAFAKSVTFVISEQDLDKVKNITLQAVKENDRFYHVFRKAFNESDMA